MALVIVNTVGAATANSYCLESDIDLVATDMLLEPLAWTGLALGCDARLRAMITATKRLDKERFPRERVDGVQALEWPRAWVPKAEQYLYNGIELGYYLTTEIPAAVLRAQAELTLFLVDQAAQGVDPFAPNDDAGIASENLGGDLQTTYEVGATSRTPGARFMAGVIRPILAQARILYAMQPHVMRG